jgi:hypothetical protein
VKGLKAVRLGPPQPATTSFSAFLPARVRVPETELWPGSGSAHDAASLARSERSTARASSTRDETPTLRKMLRMCFSTVFWLRNSSLELLIESGTRPWFVVGARDEIETILVTGLAADGQPAERARDIVNRLVARGHVDYERLLQR